MIVRYTKRAERDLLEILSWLNERSRQGAASVAASLQSSVAFLSENPFGGTRTPRPGIFVKLALGTHYKFSTV
jgi:plasmid stabilization system protein ParE